MLKNLVITLLLFCISLHASSDTQEIKFENSLPLIDIPKLKSSLIDTVDILTPSQEKNLTQLIENIFKAGGPPIQVIIIPSLNSESIEDFSKRSLDYWRGQREQNREGVLIISSMQDRAIKMEVEKGLQSTITDYESHLMVNEILIPHFKDKEYFKGLEMVILKINEITGLYLKTEKDLQAPKKILSLRMENALNLRFFSPLIIFFLSFPLILKFIKNNNYTKPIIGAAYAGILTYFFIPSFFFIVLAVLLGFFIGFMQPFNLIFYKINTENSPSHLLIPTQSQRPWSKDGRFFKGGGIGGKW